MFHDEGFKEGLGKTWPETTLYKGNTRSDGRSPRSRISSVLRRNGEPIDTAPKECPRPSALWSICDTPTTNKALTELDCEVRSTLSRKSTRVFFLPDT